MHRAPYTVIGGSNDQSSFLRSGPLGPQEISVSTPNILSADNYELFILRSWNNGTLAMYDGYNTAPFISYDYGTPKEVDYVGGA